MVERGGHCKNAIALFPYPEWCVHSSESGREAAVSRPCPRQTHHSLPPAAPPKREFAIWRGGDTRAHPLAASPTPRSNDMFGKKKRRTRFGQSIRKTSQESVRWHAWARLYLRTHWRGAPHLIREGQTTPPSGRGLPRPRRAGQGQLSRESLAIHKSANGHRGECGRAEQTAGRGEKLSEMKGITTVAQESR